MEESKPDLNYVSQEGTKTTLGVIRLVDPAKLFDDKNDSLNSINTSGNIDGGSNSLLPSNYLLNTIVTPKLESPADSSVKATSDTNNAPSQPKFEEVETKDVSLFSDKQSVKSDECESQQGMSSWKSGADTKEPQKPLTRIEILRRKLGKEQRAKLAAVFSKYVNKPAAAPCETPKSQSSFKSSPEKDKTGVAVPISSNQCSGDPKKDSTNGKQSHSRISVVHPLVNSGLDIITVDDDSFEKEDTVDTTKVKVEPTDPSESSSKIEESQNGKQRSRKTFSASKLVEADISLPFSLMAKVTLLPNSSLFAAQPVKPPPPVNAVKPTVKVCEAPIEEICIEENNPYTAYDQTRYPIKLARNEMCRAVLIIGDERYKCLESPNHSQGKFPLLILTREDLDLDGMKQLVESFVIQHLRCSGKGKLFNRLQIVLTVGWRDLITVTETENGRKHVALKYPEENFATVLYKKIESTYNSILTSVSKVSKAAIAFSHVWPINLREYCDFINKKSHVELNADERKQLVQTSVKLLNKIIVLNQKLSRTKLCVSSALFLLNKRNPSTHWNTSFYTSSLTNGLYPNSSEIVHLRKRVIGLFKDHVYVFNNHHEIKSLFLIGDKRLENGLNNWPKNSKLYPILLLSDEITTESFIEVVCNYCENDDGVVFVPSCQQFVNVIHSECCEGHHPFAYPVFNTNSDVDSFVSDLMRVVQRIKTETTLSNLTLIMSSILTINIVDQVRDMVFVHKMIKGHTGLDEIMEIAVVQNDLLKKFVAKVNKNLFEACIISNTPFIDLTKCRLTKDVNKFSFLTSNKNHLHNDLLNTLHSYKIDCDFEYIRKVNDVSGLSVNIHRINMKESMKFSNSDTQPSVSNLVSRSEDNEGVKSIHSSLSFSGNMLAQSTPLLVQAVENPDFTSGNKVVDTLGDDIFAQSAPLLVQTVDNPGFASDNKVVDSLDDVTTPAVASTPAVNDEMKSDDMDISPWEDNSVNDHGTPPVSKSRSTSVDSTSLRPSSSLSNQSCSKESSKGKAKHSSIKNDRGRSYCSSTSRSRSPYDKTSRRSRSYSRDISRSRSKSQTRFIRRKRSRSTHKYSKSRSHAKKSRCSTLSSRSRSNSRSRSRKRNISRSKSRDRLNRYKSHRICPKRRFSRSSSRSVKRRRSYSRSLSRSPSRPRQQRKNDLCTRIKARVMDSVNSKYIAPKKSGMRSPTSKRCSRTPYQDREKSLKSCNREKISRSPAKSTRSSRKVETKNAKLSTKSVRKSSSPKRQEQETPEKITRKEQFTPSSVNDRRNAIIMEHRAQYEKFEANPQEHPDYNTEFAKFLTHSNSSLTSTHFVQHWAKFWADKMKTIEDDKLEAKLTLLELEERGKHKFTRENQQLFGTKLTEENNSSNSAPSVDPTTHQQECLDTPLMTVNSLVHMMNKFGSLGLPLPLIKAKVVDAEEQNKNPLNVFTDEYYTLLSLIAKNLSNTVNSQAANEIEKALSSETLKSLNSLLRQIEIHKLVDMETVYVETHGMATGPMIFYIVKYLKSINCDEDPDALYEIICANQQRIKKLQKKHIKEIIGFKQNDLT